MHTLSSAKRTYMASASAVECTATVLMPIVRQARWIRSAISPRLAIRIFPNIDLDAESIGKGARLLFSRKRAMRASEEGSA